MSFMIQQEGICRNRLDQDYVCAQKQMQLYRSEQTAFTLFLDLPSSLELKNRKIYFNATASFEECKTVYLRIRYDTRAN
jgi:hypothetical protein